MPVEKFHSQTARLLDPQTKSIEYYVDGFNVGYPGSLGLRVSPRGKKVWFVAYRLHGSKSKQKYNLAGWPAMSQTQATKDATRILRTVADGVDPKAAKRDKLAAPTFADLIPIYLKHYASKKKDGGHSDSLKLAHKRLEPIRSMKAQDIRRRHIVAIMDGMKDEGKAVQGNRYLSLLRKLFSVCIRRDLLPELFSNPCTEVDRPGVETPSDRVYLDVEICALLKSFKSMPLLLSPALKILLLTGQRSTEIYGLCWSEVDVDAGLITLSPKRVKNGKEHVVPMSRQVVDIISDQDRTSEFVFPARTKCGHVVMSNRRLDKIRKLSEVSDFRVHTMRRTAATGLADLGVDELIIARVLNHAISGVTVRHYNKHQYVTERRIALQKWADKLDRITGKTASKVVDLRAQA